MAGKRWTTWVGAGLVVVAMLSACGSSKSASSAAAKTTTTTAPTTTSTRSSGSDNGSSDDTSGGSGGSGLALNVQQCAKAAEVYGQIIAEPGELMAGSASGKSPSQIQDQINSIKADIPAKLKDDYTTVAQAYAKYGEALKGIDFSKVSTLLNPDTLKKLNSADQDLQSSSVTNASNHIQSYFGNSCS
jgi:hypothetical protein